jgi:hypothetical protein
LTGQGEEDGEQREKDGRVRRERIGVAAEWLDIGGSVVEISVFSLNKSISILGSWI